MDSKKVTSKLGSIGKVSMCKRVLKHQTTEFGEIPFYKISTFGGKADSFITKDLYDEFRDKYSFPKKGDILISAAGTIGETVIYDGKPAYFQDSNIVWIDNDETKILNSFLYYFYQTKPWLTTNGSTIKRIYNDNLRSIEITYPESLEDQQKIAAVLTALDAKIELNARINAELEQVAKTLYDYWFVQFAPHKSAGGKMVWNEALKREIPLGWKNGTLSDLGTITGGSTPSKEVDEYFTDNGTAWITPKDLSLNTGNKFITKGELDVSEKGLKAASLTIMPRGTILLSSRAPIGYMAIAREEVTTNQGFKSFILNKGYSIPFVYYTVKNAIPTIINHSSGSTFKEASATVLKSIAVCLPPVSLTEKYKEAVDAIFERQNKLELESQTLTELRDWLLPMLMNGQVKV